MKAYRKAFGHRAPRRSFVGVALLVVCALLGHSLDSCAVHLGLIVRPAGTLQLKRACPDAASDLCRICPRPDDPHADGCALLSEAAIRSTPHNAEIECQPATLAATAAVLPALPQVIALSGCLHGRAGPPTALPASVSLRSSLPSRAPPLSA